MLEWAKFLATRRVTDTPRGDFLTDAYRDADMLNADSWDKVDFILRRKHACVEAIREGRKLWRQYQKALTIQN